MGALVQARPRPERLCGALSAGPCPRRPARPEAQTGPFHSLPGSAPCLSPGRVPAAVSATCGRERPPRAQATVGSRLQAEISILVSGPLFANSLSDRDVMDLNRKFEKAKCPAAEMRCSPAGEAGPLERPPPSASLAVADAGILSGRGEEMTGFATVHQRCPHLSGKGQGSHPFGELLRCVQQLCPQSRGRCKGRRQGF